MDGTRDIGGTKTVDRRGGGLLGSALAETPSAEIALLQYERLLALAPLLHMAIALNTLAATIALHGSLPELVQLIFPGLLVCSSIVRFAIWLRRRSKPVSLAAARKQLRIAFWLALIIGVVAGVGGIIVFALVEETKRIVIVIFMAFGAFATANCLASIPRAATAAIMGSLAPLACVLLTSSDVAEFASGASLILVTALQLKLVSSQYQAMVNAQTLQTAMRELADTDPLTGLKNRRALDRTLQTATQAEIDFSLILLDLDGFKKVNDQNGHAIGDALLIQVAERLTACAGPGATIARLGGDEFAIITPGFNLSHELAETVERLTTMLALPYICEETWVSISASAGVARFGKDGQSAAELLKVADRAAYLAKSALRRSESRPAAPKSQRPRAA